MVLQTVVEQCVTGLGYELVDIEHGPGGLLRVFIDVVPGSGLEFVRIEDCERVSHQLTHLMTVENIDYARLEVSSPGLDRPLKKAADFERFQGCEATVRLRRPLQGRRNFEGVITVEPEGRFGLVMDDGAAAAGAGKTGRGGKAGARGKGRSNAKARAASPEQAVDSPQSGEQQLAAPAAGSKGSESAPAEGASGGEAATLRKLVFALDEIDRARLVPKVKF